MRLNDDTLKQKAKRLGVAYEQEMQVCNTACSDYPSLKSFLILDILELVQCEYPEKREQIKRMFDAGRAQARLVILGEDPSSFYL